MAYFITAKFQICYLLFIVILANFNIGFAGNMADAITLEKASVPPYSCIDQLSINPSEIRSSVDMNLFFDQLREIGRELKRPIRSWAMAAGGASQCSAQIKSTIEDVLIRTYQLAMELPDGSPYQKFILAKIEHIRNDDNQDMRNAYRTIKDRYKKYHFKESNIYSDESSPVLRLLGRPLNFTRGLWSEILSLSQFSNVVGTDIKMIDVISKEAKNKFSSEQATGLWLERWLSLEVDLILSNNHWIEIKNFESIFGSDHPSYANVREKMKILAQLIKYENELKGRNIKLSLIIFGKGVSVEAIKEFEKLGIQIESRPSLL